MRFLPEKWIHVSALALLLAVWTSSGCAWRSDPVVRAQASSEPASAGHATLRATQHPVVLAEHSQTALQDEITPAPLAEAPSQEGDEAGGGIQDNSFFVEEAYNQEAGIVQHIFNAVRLWDADDGHARFFDFAFTQEWPVGSQKHQFSYTLPFASFFEHPDGQLAQDEEGMGDMLLNYRYQLLAEDAAQPAIAPRFSLILPTGNEREGLGHGELGYQLNLPMSKEVGSFAYHFNAGMSVIPDANVRLDRGVTSPYRDLVGYNLGASAICIADDVVQPLVELVAFWDEAIDDRGSEDDTFELILSPGFRWAPYTQGSNQIVVGGAVPIGLSTDAPDIGLFLYFSVEHPFQQTPDTCCSDESCRKGEHL